MNISYNEEVAAPEVAAPEVAAPEVAAPEVAAPVVSGIECTRDSDCPVNDCENCS